MRMMRAQGAVDAAAGVAKLATTSQQHQKGVWLVLVANARIEAAFGCFFRHMRNGGYQLALDSGGSK
jgi:hypothetical protein